MRDTMKDRVKAGGVFLAVFAVLAALLVALQANSYNAERNRYEYIASDQTNIMLDCIDRVVCSAHTLSALVKSHNGSTDFFEQDAPSLFKETTGETGIELRNIAVAPKGVVKKVYPLKGNESLVGFDFFDKSKPGNKAAFEARDTKSLVITNPFSLVQGGMGIAARMPVLLDGEKANDGFWGLITVTMDFDDLVSSLHLEALENMGADYRLWYTDANGQQQTLASSPSLPDSPVTETTTAKGIEWNLDVAPSQGWIDWRVIAIEAVVAFGLSLLVAELVRQHRRINRANAKLLRLANLDNLTSCYSRHYVNTILVNQLTGKWNDPDSKYSVAIIDIDRFKTINDTYGHDIGDEAIVAIADVLKSSCRAEDGDCVIRHGGDEFVVIYNDVTEKRFRDKLESISQNARDIRLESNPEIRLTVSIGGEYFADAESKLYYDMLKQADDKLYEAKEGGRNLIVV